MLQELMPLIYKAVLGELLISTKSKSCTSGVSANVLVVLSGGESSTCWLHLYHKVVLGQFLYSLTVVRTS